MHRAKLHALHESIGEFQRRFHPAHIPINP
jgi:hypothetical protein